MLYQRTEETTEELRRQQLRLATLRSRADVLQAEVESASRQVAEAQSIADEAQAKVDDASALCGQLRSDLHVCSLRNDELRKRHVALMHSASEQSAEAAAAREPLNEVLAQIAATQALVVVNQNTEQAARKTAEMAAARLKQIHGRIAKSD